MLQFGYLFSKVFARSERNVHAVHEHHPTANNAVVMDDSHCPPNMRNSYQFGKKILFMSSLLLLVGCTATAKSDGSCTRAKGPCPIGGGKLKGQAITNKLTIKNCTVGSTLSNQKYQFLIFEDTSGSSTTSGTTIDPAAVPTRIPKAGIAFTPITPGEMTLVTPSDEWCTDSCGIATVEFTPKCQEQSVNVGVHVPGMLFEGTSSIPSTEFVIEID